MNVMFLVRSFLGVQETQPYGGPISTSMATSIGPNANNNPLGSFNVLPTEILDEICSYLAHQDRRRADLINFGQTCRTAWNVATRWLYRSITINIPPESMLQSISNWWRAFGQNYEEGMRVFGPKHIMCISRAEAVR